MKYTSIIFDMDGTIVDTEAIWIEAIYILLLERDVVLTDALKDEINILNCGLHVTDMCKQIKKMCSLTDSVADLVHELEERVYQMYENNVRFIPGFMEFFAQLKELGIKTAIATNATDEALELTNRILKLYTLFGSHMYAISRVAGAKKPAPDIFLYAAQQLKSKPSECIVFEDSRYGVAAAKAAGMYCIGINDSDLPELTAQADRVIPNFIGLDAKKLCEGN